MELDMISANRDAIRERPVARGCMRLETSVESWEISLPIYCTFALK